MPCKNGGECGNYIGRYMCHCTKDYYGGICDSEYYFMTLKQHLPNRPTIKVAIMLLELNTTDGSSCRWTVYYKQGVYS